MYKDIKAKILAKHENTLYFDDQNNDGLPKCEINVYQPRTDTSLGVIQMGILVMKVYPFSKSFYISYEDNINMRLFEKHRSDDL